VSAAIETKPKPKAVAPLITSTHWYQWCQETIDLFADREFEPAYTQPFPDALPLPPATSIGGPESHPTSRWCALCTPGIVPPAGLARSASSRHPGRLVESPGQDPLKPPVPPGDSPAPIGRRLHPAILSLIPFRCRTLPVDEDDIQTAKGGAERRGNQCRGDAPRNSCSVWERPRMKSGVTS
jgi:hypothetical protein